MGLLKTVKAANTHSPMLSQERYVSNPVTNLARVARNGSSYNNFLKELAGIDKKTAEELVKDTTIELWKRQQKDGKYEGRDVLSYNVAAHFMGLPEDQDKLERHLMRLSKTDSDKSVDVHKELAYLSEMTKELMYKPGGLMFSGGPTSNKRLDLEQAFGEMKDPSPIAVRTAGYKILQFLTENNVTVGYEERKLRKPKPVLENFDYEVVREMLDKYGDRKEVVKKVCKACKMLERGEVPVIEGRKKLDLPDLQTIKTEAKLFRKAVQNEEGYHPLMNKILATTLVLGTTAVIAERIYNAFNSGGIFPSLPADEEGSYARSKGLSEDVIKTIKSADNNNALDAGEKIVIDYLATLDKPLQQKVVDAVYEDNVLTGDEVDNTRFLDHLPKDEAAQIIDGGNATNLNIDGDSWSNAFEEFVSKTPYNVKNDIYAIVMTHAGQEYMPVKETFNILEKAKIPKDHIYELNGESNNSVEFKTAVDKVAQVADKNDTVLFVINGEGIPGGFQFHGTVENGVWRPLETVPYTWFRDVTGNIISKNKVLIFDTCYSGSAIKDLQDKNKFILTGCTAEQTGGFVITQEFLKAFSNPLADSNKNSYVSIGEASEYAKSIRTAKNTTPQISDLGNIGSSSYLLEIELED